MPRTPQWKQKSTVFRNLRQVFSTKLTRKWNRRGSSVWRERCRGTNPSCRPRLLSSWPPLPPVSADSQETFQFGSDSVPFIILLVWERFFIIRKEKQLLMVISMCFLPSKFLFWKWEGKDGWEEEPTLNRPTRRLNPRT